jgi:hypothetical protein
VSAPTHDEPRRERARAAARSRQLEHARPLHAIAFGVALGAASGVLLFGLTAIELAQTSHGQFRDSLALLGEFFAGYRVTWPGAVVGFLWSAAVGFSVGWGLATIRNRMLSASLYFLKRRIARGGPPDAIPHHNPSSPGRRSP